MDKRLNNRILIRVVVRMLLVTGAVGAFWILCIVASAIDKAGWFDGLFVYIPVVSGVMFLIGVVWAFYMPSRCPICKGLLVTILERGKEERVMGNDTYSFSTVEPDKRWHVCHRCGLRSEQGEVVEITFNGR